MVTGTTNGCTDTDHVSVHVNKAKWDHVSKGNDTGCDSCNGSIIVDANYNATGEFRVQYTFDGNTVTEGPFTASGDITLDHLCAGTYSNITIIGVYTPDVKRCGHMTSSLKMTVHKSVRTTPLILVIME